MTYVYRFRVRYHETDPQGYVFNSRYLEYADVAMSEFFRHLGWGYPEMLALGFDPALVSSHLDYKAPAHLDEELSTHVSCIHLGRSSFTLQMDVRRDQSTLCSIKNVYVNVEASAKAPRPIPEPVHSRVRVSMEHRTGNDGAIEERRDQ